MEEKYIKFYQSFHKGFRGKKSNSLFCSSQSLWNSSQQWISRGFLMLINNQVFITRFVIFTFCVTAIHFILESLYTIQFGQSFLGLLPDLIADALLVTGGVLVLKNSKAIGILCLSLIHIWRCRRYAVCRSRWSPYH